ncbi:MAG: hypothetical protein AB8I08_39770 [Sandaracinaceae bacterium]
MLPTSRVSGLLVLSLCLSLVACDGDDRDRDAGPPDAGARDSGAALDSGTDAGTPIDAGADSGTDAGPVDGGMDAGSDGGPTDGGPVDGGPVDSGPVDSGPPIDGGPFVGGDTCALAFDVTAGGTFRGTTVGASDTYDDRPTIGGGGCAFGTIASSYDVAYSVTPSTATNYRVTVTTDRRPDGGVPMNPQIWVATDCDQSECPDGTRFQAGNVETHSFTAPPGETTFIVVEGEIFGQRADFTIEVVVE